MVGVSTLEAAKQLLNLSEAATSQIRAFKGRKAEKRNRVASLLDQIADTIHEIGDCFKVAHEKPENEYNMHCFDVWYMSKNITDKIRDTLPKNEIFELRSELDSVFKTKDILDALYSKLSGRIIDTDIYEMTKGMETVYAAEGKFRAAAKLLRAI